MQQCLLIVFAVSFYVTYRFHRANGTRCVVYFCHMEQPRSHSRYILVVLCVIVVSTAVVLVGLNAWMQQFGTAPVKDKYTEGYVKGYSDARERLLAAGLIMRPIEANVLTGSVVSVGKDFLIVRQTNLDSSPIVDSVPDERTVLVTSSTKILSRTMKTREVMDKEIVAFLASGRPPDEMPLADTQVIVPLSGITVGASVIITTSVDVRLAPTVNATQIVDNVQ
jgi:hypothetical protein